MDGKSARGKSNAFTGHTCCVACADPGPDTDVHFNAEFDAFVGDIVCLDQRQAR
jgi:hypothetical protein